MTGSVRVSATVLTRLARGVLDASGELGHAWATRQPSLVVAAGALGGGDAAVALSGAHDALVESAGVTIGRQLAVLETDVDRLNQTAAAIQHLEDANARRLSRTGGRR